MDLSFIMPFLNGLGWYGPLIGIGLTLLFQRLNLKLPSLPSLTPKPDPVPSPAPNPILPLPTDHPLLNLLLQILNVKATGNVTPEDHPLVDLLVKEASALKQVKL